MIYFKVVFNKPFLIFSDNLVTSAKCEGSGMKFDIFDPNYPNVGNKLCNLFTTFLKILYKPLSILFDDISVTFHSFFLFNMVTYLKSSISCVNGWMYFAFILNVLKSVQTYISVIRVTICI